MQMEAVALRNLHDGGLYAIGVRFDSALQFKKRKLGKLDERPCSPISRLSWRQAGYRKAMARLGLETATVAPRAEIKLARSGRARRKEKRGENASDASYLRETAAPSSRTSPACRRACKAMCSTSFASRQRARRPRHALLVEEKGVGGESGEKNFGRFWRRSLARAFFLGGHCDVEAAGEKAKLHASVCEGPSASSGLRVDDGNASIAFKLCKDPLVVARVERRIREHELLDVRDRRDVTRKARDEITCQRGEVPARS
jgi:hypothetical protein